MYPLFCAHARQITRCMHLIGWRLALKLAEHAQLIIFCPVSWKKVGTIHENVFSFCSVYNGELQLCMYLLCDFSQHQMIIKIIIIIIVIISCWWLKSSQNVEYTLFKMCTVFRATIVLYVPGTVYVIPLQLLNILYIFEVSTVI